MDRRALIGSALGGAALAVSAAGDAALAQDLPRPTETRKGGMLYRSFGKTGESVSAIGVGSSRVGQTEEAHAARPQGRYRRANHETEGRESSTHQQHSHGHRTVQDKDALRLHREEPFVAGLAKKDTLRRP